MTDELSKLIRLRMDGNKNRQNMNIGGTIGPLDVDLGISHFKHNKQSMDNADANLKLNDKLSLHGYMRPGRMGNKVSGLGFRYKF